MSADSQRATFGCAVEIRSASSACVRPARRRASRIKCPPCMFITIRRAALLGQIFDALSYEIAPVTSLCSMHSVQVSSPSEAACHVMTMFCRRNDVHPQELALAV